MPGATCALRHAATCANHGEPEVTDIYDISSAPSARMCDFGRRLEAALKGQFDDTCDYSASVVLARLLEAVRAANAQASAPAPVMESPSTKPADMSGAGAGIDLPPAMATLRATANGAWDSYAAVSRDECRALLSHIESLERDAERYRWLMDEGSGNSPLARANRIYARWNGEDGAEGFSRVVDAARKEGKP